MNLATILDPHPADAPALISRSRTTTYGDLRDQAGRLRAGLLGLGVEAGDRVAIVCANNWYFVVAYFAVLGTGAVAVPLNPLSPSRALGTQLGAVGAKVAVVGPSGRSALGGVDRAAVPDLRHVVATGAGDADDGSVALDDLLASEPAPMVDRDADDTAVLMFTSGTAGSPRAAVLSHGNLLANIDQVLAMPGVARVEGDVSLCVLPLFHIMGLNAILGVALRAGSTLLLMERFDPQSAVEAIQRWSVTVIAGAPAMWGAWSSLPGIPPGAFAGVRLASSGAAALPPEVAERMRSRFGVELSEGYGLTEASPVVTSTLGLEPRRGSIGAPLDGIEVRLVDDGDDVLVGDEGEIWVRGANVFQGYWGDDRGACHALTEDGWLRTGDVGVVDDDGYLFLVDRAKDLIIVSGFNVFPAEVEEVLVQHPAIVECAVVGVDHPYSGEAVKAFVVVAPGRDVEEDDINAFCADHLPRYKCPEKVAFVEELPHGLGGKVLKRELRRSVPS